MIYRGKLQGVKNIEGIRERKKIPLHRGECAESQAVDSRSGKI